MMMMMMMMMGAIRERDEQNNDKRSRSEGASALGFVLFKFQNAFLASDTTSPDSFD
jgi:hypothetical protein